MPPLIGDVITRVRNAANDPCQVLGQPVGPTAAAGGAGLFSGSIYGILTYLNNWGETVGSNEVGPVSGLSNQAINLSAMVPPYGATSARFYYGAASGQEQQFITFTPGVTATVGKVTDTPTSGVPPYKPSAYLPDTDGDLVDASTMYRWMNAGLVQLGRLAGGILDETGVAMPAGNAEVVIPGWWLSIKYTWHNGWLVLPETQSYTWLQSPVQGIPGISTLWRNGAKQVLGTWPQPATSPAVSALIAPMGSTDSLANVISTAGLLGSDGAMALNSTTLNSAIGGFGADMVGLPITVVGAGPGGTNLTTTIQNYITTNQVTLAVAASTAVVGAIFTVSGTGAPSFTAPGMCQIDDEIMSYSQTGNTQLTGLIRGAAGTIPAAHEVGAPVSQLIFRLLGRRMPVPIALGQSTNTLDLPQGWDTVLDYYLLSYFKQTEQNVEEADRLMKVFEAKGIELRDDQIPLESKQVGGLYPLGDAAATLADVMDTVIVE